MGKILVIEDNEPSRANLVELLEAKGLAVISGANGFAGLRLAVEHLPDLIFCNALLSEMDGYAVLRILSQDPTTASIPFVFLAAESTDEGLRQAMELGADDYLTKPFTQDKLLRAIAVHMRKTGH